MNSKKRTKTSNTADAFAVDFTHCVGTKVEVPGSFWGLKGTDGDELENCIVKEYDADHTFTESSKKVCYLQFTMPL